MPVFSHALNASLFLGGLGLKIEGLHTSPTRMLFQGSHNKLL